ncbi:MAG: glycosyltransferase family 4 protein [Thaumarchaeota archaeon]|nr:glycosyltransferase family 4 protein [Nitrososphaerota archaeon]
MKIALVCPASLPATQFGGILFLCVDIARELAKIGHDVTIYTTDLDFANNPKTFNKKLPRLEEIQGFKINRTHVWFSFQLFYVNPSMYNRIKNDKPDIIHTVGIRSFQSLIAALVSKRHKIPLVISDQGGLTTHPDLTGGSIIKKIIYKLQMPMVKFIINQASKISVANDYEKDIFEQFKDKSKITTIKNGINLDSMQSNNIDFKKKYSINQNFILFLGRFHKVKGVDVLLRAWELLKNKSEAQNIKLVIMGVDFGFESEMFRMIKDLDIGDSVIVIKKPPREDVIAAYQACEFLVLPSRWELSPLTPLEGFAFKKAVISTKTHGVPYTIEDGKNALLVEPEDHTGLSEAILKLLKNSNMKIELGLAGYKMVNDTCNSMQMASNTLKLYETILG